MQLIANLKKEHIPQKRIVHITKFFLITDMITNCQYYLYLTSHSRVNVDCHFCTKPFLHMLLNVPEISRPNNSLHNNSYTNLYSSNSNNQTLYEVPLSERPLRNFLTQIKHPF